MVKCHIWDEEKVEFCFQSEAWAGERFVWDSKVGTSQEFALGHRRHLRPAWPSICIMEMSCLVRHTKNSSYKALCHCSKLVLGVTTSFSPIASIADLRLSPAASSRRTGRLADRC